MLTRREVVIEKPFRDRRYKNHRRKVRSAVPRIDNNPPPTYIHLDIKMKKLRLEVDRQNKICHDNIGLLHRMSIIMRTKRMDDINTLSKGPFEKKKNLRPMSTMVKTRIRSPYDEKPSFLEAITKEASRRNPICHLPRTIEHRAPHGFCKVPQLGLPAVMSNPRASHYGQHYSKAKPTKPPVSIVSRMIEELETEVEIDSKVAFDLRKVDATSNRHFHECRPRTARIKSARSIRPNKDLSAQTSKRNEEPSSEAEGGSSLSSVEGLKKVSERSLNHYSQSFSSEDKSTEYSIVDKILSKIEYSIESDSDEKQSESIEDHVANSQDEITTEEDVSEEDLATTCVPSCQNGLQEVIEEELNSEMVQEKNNDDELFTEEAMKIRAEGKHRKDSDEQVSSILLGLTPNITVDQASDDDFFK